MASLAEPSCVVLDVGGTFIRAALFCLRTKSLKSIIIRDTPNIWTKAFESELQMQTALLQIMQELVEKVLPTSRPDILSISFPGPINPSGEVLCLPTVWGDANRSPFPIQSPLQKIWPDSKIYVMNDVAAAGYEVVASGLRDFCIITVSSGIGNKIFLDGVCIVGPHGRGGEIGHLRVDDAEDALLCACGEKGHLGAIASGRGTLASAKRKAQRDPESYARSLLAQKFTANLDDLKNEDLVAAFHADDEWTLKLITHTASYLAAQIAAVHINLGIEKNFIIGGFALAMGEKYRKLLVTLARASCWDLGQSWESMIVLRESHEHACLGGAGQYVATQYAEI